MANLLANIGKHVNEKVNISFNHIDLFKKGHILVCFFIFQLICGFINCFYIKLFLYKKK